MKLILHTGINSKDQKRIGSLLEMIGETNDTIRDCNSANEFRVFLQGILESEGAVDPEVVSLFDIVMVLTMVFLSLALYISIVVVEGLSLA